MAGFRKGPVIFFFIVIARPKAMAISNDEITSLPLAMTIKRKNLFDVRRFFK